jgi:diaminopimelate decarboxylase
LNVSFHVSNCILFVFSCSFHVGSGCQEAGAFEAAIEQARDVFDMGLDMGFKMDLLDIGGGYPGQETDGISFEEVNNSSSILREVMIGSKKYIYCPFTKIYE